MRRVFAAVIFVLIIACIMNIIADDIDPGMAETVKNIKAELPALDLSGEPDNSAAALGYFKCYGLDVKNVDHFFGTVSICDQAIAVNVFRPEKSAATVLCVHGYYDHAGVWKHVISRLAAEGYTVVIYDQPGHGLSGGKRASIKDFSDYVKVLDAMLKLCGENFEGPLYVAAHSTGCSAVIDYLLTRAKVPFRKAILMAPLVRSVAWKMSGFGHGIGKTFTDEVPRKFRKNSHDKKFLEFMKKDPLQPRVVPLDWVDAHRKWVERIEKAESSDYKVKIIQGRRDTTVSWTYNMPLLRKKFPNADITMMSGAGHQLINEKEDLREKTLKLLSDWFKGE